MLRLTGQRRGAIGFAGVEVRPLRQRQPPTGELEVRQHAAPELKKHTRRGEPARKGRLSLPKTLLLSRAENTRGSPWSAEKLTRDTKRIVRPRVASWMVMVSARVVGCGWLWPGCAVTLCKWRMHISCRAGIRCSGGVCGGRCVPGGDGRGPPPPPPPPGERKERQCFSNEEGSGTHKVKTQPQSRM